MAYSVVPVSDKRRLDEFLRLPFDLYRGDPLWVPPLAAEVRRTLDPERNPYFAAAALRLFVCYRDSLPVARLAVVISGAHREAFGVRAAFFGFFESANDEQAVKHLFAEAETFCLDRNAEILEGPFNPHHYSEIGLQIDRFGTAPSFFQPYNPPYYPELLEQAGYRISARLQTMANDDVARDLVRRFGDLPVTAGGDGYTVRSFSLADKARDLADLVKFVEHHGRPVAVLHCVLDINPLLRRWRGAAGPVKLFRFVRGRKAVKTIILFTVAIKREHRRSVVSRLLLAEFCRMARPFARAETTWMSADNRSALKAAASLGMRPDKHFAVYAKELGR